MKNETSYIKHGFHLQFPNLFISNEIFNFIETELSKNDKDYDKICGKPWLLYPMTKGINLQPYKPDFVLTSDNFEIEPDIYFVDYKLYDIKEKQIKYDPTNPNQMIY